MQQEAVGAVDVVVITDLAETEGSRELIGGSPSNTGLNGHSVSALGVEQGDVTAEVGKQEELVADGAASVTEVRLEEQGVHGIRNGSTENFHLGLVVVVINAESKAPLLVEVVADFRGKTKSGVILFNLGTDVIATNPKLGV